MGTGMGIDMTRTVERVDPKRGILRSDSEMYNFLLTSILREKTQALTTPLD